MTSTRTAMTALAIVLALLGASAAPPLAGVVGRDCPSSHHVSCRSAAITSACCDSDTSNQGSPAASRIQLPADSALVVFVAARADHAGVIRTAFRVQTTPRAAPVDRSTLFACLLI